MNDPDCYRKFNQWQQRDAIQTIKEFSSVFKWRLDRKDSLIDIGTGTGELFMELIYSLMPESFEKIVGIDISPKMIEHCKKTYGKVDKVEFKVLDIGSEKLPKEYIGEFDHVTSFYCFHWVKDQRKAFGNIYEMLKSEGDCLFAILGFNVLFVCFEMAANTPKFAQYLQHHYGENISPFAYSEDPKIDLSRILKDVGFDDFHVEVRNKVFDYKCLENLRSSMRAVNPFGHLIPITMQEEFIDELIKNFYRLNIKQTAEENDIFKVDYKLVIVHATKRSV